MVITLLRHAPLALRYQKRFIGHSDIDIDLKLTDISKLDEIRNRKYDFVYSSDLSRCTQTLDLLKLEYKKDSRLREVKFKKNIECKNFEELEKLEFFDSKYLSSMKKWHSFICAETLEEFQERINSFFEELPKNSNILICSHGGTIKMLDSIIKKESYEESLFKISYLEFFDYNI